MELLPLVWGSCSSSTMPFQDPSATQNERIQQLRANIARDLALESTVARRQRQAVSPPTVVEPRRLITASRLDVGRLKERFERMDASPSKVKHWTVNPPPEKPEQSCPLEGPPGLAALEITKTKQLTPEPTSYGPVVCSKWSACSGHPDIDSQHVNSIYPESEDTSTIKAVQQAAIIQDAACFDSQSYDARAKGMADGAAQPSTVPRSKQANKRVSRKVSMTASTNDQVLKEPWDVAGAPDAQGGVSSTGIVFTCVLPVPALY